jgi:hypothetical protein
LPPLDRVTLAVLVALKVLIHIPGLTRYGYFRDELYFLDLARHLDWGYVDCAPLAAVYAEENRPIFICREPLVTMAEALPELKHWN